MIEDNPRRELLGNMQQLAMEGKTCASCSGVCCTFVANSMLVTTAEADALIANLQAKDLLTTELVEACKETVTRFSLDRPIPGTGSRNLLRRRYTCPLFKHKSLGCPLDAPAKPYGCLAFNPTVVNETNGGKCRSDTNLLEKTENLLSNLEYKHRIKQDRVEAKLVEKLTIPQAILSHYALRKT